MVLNQLIQENAGINVNLPVIEVQASEVSEREKLFMQQIASFDLVFFISVNAVNFALQLINGKIEELQKTQLIAVGKATADALAKKGLNNVLRPTQGFNSEAILAMPELQSLPKARCLIIRGDGGRELLATNLRARGALVEYVEVYQKSLATSDTQEVCEYLLNDELEAILIYSVVALHNLIALLAEDGIKKHLFITPIVVISQRVYLAAKKVGFTQIIIADEASDAAMINALLNGESRG